MAETDQRSATSDRQHEAALQRVLELLKKINEEKPP